MIRTTYDRLIQSLLLVRLGQELGADSSTAQSIAHAIDFLLLTLARFVS
jgi:hypothetical protein